MYEIFPVEKQPLFTLTFSFANIYLLNTLMIPHRILMHARRFYTVIIMKTAVIGMK